MKNSLDPRQPGDPVFEGWLTRQAQEAAELSAASDIVTATPVPWPFGPPRAFAVDLRCRGFVRARNGEIREQDRFAALVHFGPRHLLEVEPATLARVEPRGTWHPNSRDGFVCMGARAGMGLVDVIYTLYDLITYRLVTMTERDALNADACRWARQNLHRFPTERRPLRRRSAREDSLEAKA